jgi:hypothetical protein
MSVERKADKEMLTNNLIGAYRHENAPENVYILFNSTVLHPV